MVWWLWFLWFGGGSGNIPAAIEEGYFSEVAGQDWFDLV